MLNPQQFQLQMFMKPSEITDLPGFYFNDAEEAGISEGAMRKEKLRQARGPLANSIKKEGVWDPVDIYHGNVDRYGDVEIGLHNGHHRFVVQEQREQQGEEVYLPVHHSGTRRAQGFLGVKR